MGWLVNSSFGVFYLSQHGRFLASATVNTSCDVWHAVGFTFSDSAPGQLYVDGTGPSNAHVPFLADTAEYSVQPFTANTTNISNGLSLILGGDGFVGALD